MPRIFIAIQFSHEVKATLLSLQDALRSNGVKGNYCPYGNLHMTLAFIGESYDLPAIRKAVGEVAFTPFYPHISLLRHPTSLRFTDIKVPATPITVERISVMKSERIEGELVYSEL